MVWHSTPSGQGLIAPWNAYHFRPSAKPKSCSYSSASCLRLEHRELALHECVAVSSERSPVVGLELLDLTALHSLPWALMADMVGRLVEPAVVADDEYMVVGDGAEGLVVHGVCAVHRLGFVGIRCQRSNGHRESDEVANECHPSRGGTAKLDAVPPEVEGSGANHQDEGRS